MPAALVTVLAEGSLIVVKTPSDERANDCKTPFESTCWPAAEAP
ncbi:MAG TPA: hypothetical protein VG520_05315 [Candidatus Dormibacteraeota bacterium]|jgi:hypothetical protein|nr:hypothetical protein [Candidatus Dormibacteraeota bacterium]